MTDTLGKKIQLVGDDLFVTNTERLDRGIQEGVLKAQLSDPQHPRALLTALEGFALWCGEPLDVVICADVPVDHSLGLGAFGDLDDGWPEESALVHFLFRETGRRGRRIQGVGDFGRLRRRS